ncbi:Hypothetical protein UVM_LOCUS112 [uncultured virus]|nr:Hypothetical protein UVM_LOCUS112 [uncultured virus]
MKARLIKVVDEGTECTYAIAHADASDAELLRGTGNNPSALDWIMPVGRDAKTFDHAQLKRVLRRLRPCSNLNQCRDVMRREEWKDFCGTDLAFFHHLAGLKSVRDVADRVDVCEHRLELCQPRVRSWSDSPNHADADAEDVACQSEEDDEGEEGREEGADEGKRVEESDDEDDDDDVEEISDPRLEQAKLAKVVERGAAGDNDSDDDVEEICDPGVRYAGIKRPRFEEPLFACAT